MAETYEAVEKERNRLRIENVKLKESLRKLSAEVGGILTFDLEMRQAVGNTNYNVLNQRYEEAGNVLAQGAERG